MAKNFRGVYQSRKELNQQLYGRNCEVLVERVTSNIRKWMSGLLNGLKQLTERMENRNALEGEFHIVPTNQLLLEVDDAPEQS